MSGVAGRSGGARLGAGRPRLSDEVRFFAGSRRTREANKEELEAPLEPLPEVDAPTLNAREQAIWDELAPLALAARTLVPGTAGDLKALCSLEVEMAEVLAARRREGLTSRGSALMRTYLALVKCVESKRRGFKLAPMGKDMAPPEKPKDEWSEFDAAPVQ